MAGLVLAYFNPLWPNLKLAVAFECWQRGLLHSQERTWQRRLLVRRIALKRLFCDPSNSVEYDAVTNPYCSRRSDHGVDPSARELAEIADLQPVVANECPKNIRIPG